MPVVRLGSVELKDFELVPSGSYVATIAEAELTTSSNGNPMIKFEFRISPDNEDWGNRPVWEQITLIPSAYYKLVQLLLAIGWTKEELGIGLPDGVEAPELNIDADFVSDLEGREVVIVVGQLPEKDGYKAKNNVRAYNAV